MPEEALEFDFTAYLARRLDTSPEAVAGVLGRLLVDSGTQQRRVAPAKARRIARVELACA
jgi:hypothetical protein